MWDLRSYTGRELALLIGRSQAYSYRHMERFLRLLATTHTDASLTKAVARWTTTLWQSGNGSSNASSFYVDGHRKPIYTKTLIPRGLIGRLGKIAGCRALVLLHDEQGHPLLATTHRGDLHLTSGIPHILDCYEQATPSIHLTQLVVDREAMASDFLAQLRTDGRYMTTILKTNQYVGLASFTQVGSFIPLTVDCKGTILREVAPAQFLLPRPDLQDAPLRLSVALIRDLRRSVPCQSSEEDWPRSWHADIRHEEVA
jgi:hypothetical protein